MRAVLVPLLAFVPLAAQADNNSVYMRLLLDSPSVTVAQIGDGHSTVMYANGQSPDAANAQFVLMQSGQYNALYNYSHDGWSQAPVENPNTTVALQEGDGNMAYINLSGAGLGLVGTQIGTGNYFETYGYVSNSEIAIQQNGDFGSYAWTFLDGENITMDLRQGDGGGHSADLFISNYGGGPVDVFWQQTGQFDSNWAQLDCGAANGCSLTHYSE